MTYSYGHVIHLILPNLRGVSADTVTLHFRFSVALQQAANAWAPGDTQWIICLFYKHFRYSFQSSELRSCAKVEVAILGSPFLIILMVSVDLKQYWTWTSQSTFSEATALAPHRTENQIQNSLSLLSIIIGTAPQYLADLFQIYVPSSSLRSSPDDWTFHMPFFKKQTNKKQKNSMASCPLLLWCTNHKFSFVRCSSESFSPCLQN